MPQTTHAWFLSLSDSVHALGAAAREYRMARQTAQSNSWSYDLTRLGPEVGAMRVVGRDHIRPHADSVMRLKAIHDRVETQIKGLYENAALAYAYGTAAAVNAVLGGGRPTHVELGRRDDSYEIPSDPLPDLQGALGPYIGGPNLVALREIVTEHQRVDRAVREISFYEDLSDYQSTELTDASKYAAGLADAAYQYGEAAERALHYVLTGAKAPRTTEEAS
ncbi:hypothetical protein ACJ6WF_21085 [Streptomyces sp. MMS24-I2-30]|uniref:hypothetical protein n=1 Tax=Streptomyces sp. MMS24-I2-30 TaxID=3351564 RepID=UPI0038969F4F